MICIAFKHVSLSFIPVARENRISMAFVQDYRGLKFHTLLSMLYRGHHQFKYLHTFDLKDFKLSS
jgi:hypothetical protein